MGAGAWVDACMRDDSHLRVEYVGSDTHGWVAGGATSPSPSTATGRRRRPTGKSGNGRKKEKMAMRGD